MVTQLASALHPYEQLLLDPEHQQRLLRIARKQTQGSTIAWEDAVQIAQLKVLQALRSGKFCHGGPAEFYRWSTVVARFAIIDWVRKEKAHPYISLDALLPGHDRRLLDTIADPCDASDSLEQADLVVRAIASIQHLDRQHPDRGYLPLWYGQVQGKTQTQLAQALSLSQGEVSKRWKELVSQLAIALGFVTSETMQSPPQRRGRPPRSQRLF